jgi:hypothetical protein
MSAIKSNGISLLNSMSEDFYEIKATAAFFMGFNHTILFFAV